MVLPYKAAEIDANWSSVIELIPKETFDPSNSSFRSEIKCTLTNGAEEDPEDMAKLIASLVDDI
jgi:hypothetical protein